MVVVSNILLSRQTQKEGCGTDAAITPWILSPRQVLSLSGALFHQARSHHQSYTSWRLPTSLRLQAWGQSYPALASHFGAMFPIRASGAFPRQCTDALGLASLGGANESTGSGRRGDKREPRAREAIAAGMPDDRQPPEGAGGGSTTTTCNASQAPDH